MEKKIIDWLANGETGISSKVIAFTMLGQNYSKPFSHPHDPDDFKRCLKLVIAIPEIRPRLGELRSRSAYWAALIDHWDEVESTFMDEVAEWLHNGWSKKRAHRTYELMQKIYAEAEQGESAKPTHNSAMDAIALIRKAVLDCPLDLRLKLCEVLNEYEVAQRPQ
jgi:hypothetical protein